jgi:hypothetical protein
MCQRRALADVGEAPRHEIVLRRRDHAAFRLGYRSFRLCSEVDAAEVHALGTLAEELGLKVV